MDSRHDSRTSPARRIRKGFSLMELMITLAVVAVLVALAYPSYSRYMRKANRGEAQQLLLNWANNQEIWRSNNPTYADASLNGIPVPVHDKYIFSLGAPNPPTASAYLLVATAQGDQAKDGVSSEGECAILDINQMGDKTPPTEECWD